MRKFNRNYKIVFEVGYRKDLLEYVPQQTIEVQYPFTLKFDVNRGVWSDANTGNFQIYNLGYDVQALLWKDRFDQTKYVTMWLYAGYENIMPLIFMGDVQECTSYRNGVDFITDIQATDGGYLFQYGFVNKTFSKDTDFKFLIQELLAGVPTCKVGYITSNVKQMRKRGRTFIGQTMKLLEAYNFDKVFVDNGELHILGENDVIPGQLMVLNADSGMIGTPRRSETTLNVDTIFEPQLVVAQAINLQSKIYPFLNQNYQIIGLRHYGTISPVECGNLYTSVSLSLGKYPFNELKKQIAAYTGETTGKWSKPVTGANVRITSGYGSRPSPTAGASTNHEGIDIGAPYGTPVKAAANGIVNFAGAAGGYGNVIYIDNGTIEGKRVSSRYGHLNRYIVASGTKVTQGQTIGYVGSTGKSTGPHLHFEVRENGKAVNPISYIGTY
ncbi:MAG TPA: M23 family metallopeptidase [Candidatus Stercorousia faecigallinarum]|nr:M23 family metallopeptidase [Candidatus Stercorousia faecigallinarum]